MAIFINGYLKKWLYVIQGDEYLNIFVNLDFESKTLSSSTHESCN